MLKPHTAASPYSIVAPGYTLSAGANLSAFPSFLAHNEISMKSYCLAPLALALALVLFLFVSPLFAATPTFWVDPAASPDYTFRFYAGWEECIQIARVAVITWKGRW